MRGSLEKERSRLEKRSRVAQGKPCIQTFGDQCSPNMQVHVQLIEFDGIGA